MKAKRNENVFFQRCRNAWCRAWFAVCKGRRVSQCPFCQLTHAHGPENLLRQKGGASSV